MEAEASVSASRLGGILSAESLRQRQRDRLSPRGRFAKSGRITTNVRDVGTLQRTGITLSPAPKSRSTPRGASDLRKKQLPEGLRKESSIGRRVRRDAEEGKSELTPDGGSAGREGRQFTVAKVGNNGRIYLRPTIRPASEREPSPSFVFPITPPSTAGLATRRQDDEDSHRDSLWSPTHSPSSRDGRERLPRPNGQKTGASQLRSHSCRTPHDDYSPPQDSTDAGAIKVVIGRPGTVDNRGTFVGIPTLAIPIPSYKLGTPRFSTRGTAMLRGSSFTTANSEDPRSSVTTKGHSRGYSLHRPARILSRRHSDASPQPYFAAMVPLSPQDASSLRSPGFALRPIAIVPEMYDALTFKPSCDHPSVVRYSTNGAIKAATPARLVAEITSPTFVDYDLLSDFFLTFRSFLEPLDLLLMLIARLKWALMRTDEIGTVVRVRTFVAIRHWILNYYLDDFVMDHNLRRTFCGLLNGFVAEQSLVLLPAKSPLKILGELKKCWRRVCALYWDGPDFNTELGPEIPIMPGGVAGSRDPNLDPTFWATRPDGPPRLDGIIEPDFAEADIVPEGRNFFADVSRVGHLDSMIVPRQIRSAPIDSPKSPSNGSIASETFVSCSFPARHRGLGLSHKMGAHPVPASSIYETSPVAATPKALTGKRVRPAHEHKRSASFSDAYRDRRVPEQAVQKVLFKSTELLLALPYAGSLVRGNLFPPGQAFVEIMHPVNSAGASKANTYFPGTPNQLKPSAMSGTGMKKLLGSVRRALSNRAGSISPNTSPTQGSFPQISPLGIRGATINRLPGTAVVPQARAWNTNSRASMRIDLLGAEIAEDFKKAVKEDAAAEAELQGNIADDSVQASRPNPALRYSVTRPDDTVVSLSLPHRRAALSEMTYGSKSILIIDDTAPIEPPRMAGAQPNQSVDTFADAFMQPSGGPTPPSTPPDAPLGSPRRSSQALAQQNENLSHSFENTPSLVVDSRPSGDDERSPSHRPAIRMTNHLSRGLSFRSKRSTSLRRYASFHSGYAREQSERSFDATTYSEADGVPRLSHVSSIPLPIRPLRRRPGGDLRAVDTVGDLNAHPLRRPMSTGSLTTYSESVRSSYLLHQDTNEYEDIVNSQYSLPPRKSQTFSVGQMAQPLPKPRVSLFSTHSSQPGMRPSFEKEAAMLAQIPDDDDDDGGIESALLKLEGKYEQRKSDVSGQSQTRSIPEAHNSFGVAPYDESNFSIDEDVQEKRRHRQKHVVERVLSQTPPGLSTYQPQQSRSLEELKPTVYQPRGFYDSPVAHTPRSMESYNSVPLLERGLTDDTQCQKQNWSDRSFLQPPGKDREPNSMLQTPESSHVNSFAFLHDKESIESVPKARKSKQSLGISFLDIESDSDGESDLSSELSMEMITKTELTEHESTAPHVLSRINTDIAKMEADVPLPRSASPPLTLAQALRLSPDAHKRQIMKKNLPPTPDVTPTNTHGKFSGNKSASLASPSTDPLRSNKVVEPSRKTSIHLPFILAFDSQILAQQFTLIEKDALNEIDWKDLIEMRWKDSCTESRSWVEFLRNQEPHGVEVVIARFNLMVKWAVSECVLTEDMSERIRCIIKYIHIAAHCRKYRNFATMTQITVALTSKDVARLTKTWAHVPPADIQTLRELENLVTPTQNFYNLRAEMEGSGADQGCIPFVGIYTHDLLVNFERPSQIASTPTTEPLVNFEKCRTDATIVKNLLRLLEASQLYRFLPIEGIIERCLWMAALSDDEISKYGKIIED